MKRALEIRDLPLIKRPLREECYAEPEILEGGRGDSVTEEGEGSRERGINEALAYIMHVKEILKDQRHKYQMFLYLMRDYKYKRIQLPGVIENVKELLEGHNDLLAMFNTYLPDDHKLNFTDEEDASPERVSREVALPEDHKLDFTDEEDASPERDFISKLKERFKDGGVYASLQQILNQYRLESKGRNKLLEEVSVLFAGQPDLIQEFRLYFHDASTATINQNFPAGHQFLCLREGKSPMATPSLQHIDKHQRKRKRGGKEKMEGHRYAEKTKGALLINEDCGANPSDDNDALSTKYKHEFVFFQRVKESLSILEYQEFLQCLDAYCKEELTIKDLQCSVSSLLQEYQDLSRGFIEFLKHCEDIDEFVEELKDKTESLNDRRLASKFLKVGNKNKEQKLQNGDEVIGLSNCELVTPSYRLLPEDYVTPARCTTEPGAVVLNDRLISVTSGPHIRVQKNPFEEILSNCEDDMFELDMLINCVSSTVKRAKKLLKRMDDNMVDLGSPIRIEQHFSVNNLSCIEHMYGDQGLEVVDLLGQKPLSTVPVILQRLIQKQEEWMNYKERNRNVWSKVFAQNHSKSLDHRSFNFKQQDLKNFSTKSLVTEIKEIKENKQNEDNEVLIFSSGGRVPLVSHLEFEFADTSIHEDMNELINYLCGLVCDSKRQKAKVMMLWENLLEQMLGVSIEAHTSEGIGDAEESIQSGESSETSTPDQIKEVEAVVSGSELADDESPPEEREKEESYSTVEGEEKGVLEVHCCGGGTSTLSENLFQSAKPLKEHVIPSFQNGRRDSRIIYGNENHYVLFRLHQIVYQRLLTAKKISTAAEMKEGSSSPRYLYRRFITTLYGILDGSTASANFEDDCRAMMASDCYILFTLGGLIYELVKQLQIVARDETCDKLLQLYEYESSRGKYVDSLYLGNIHLILHDDSVYRFEYLSGQSILSIQLISDAYKNDNVVAASPDPGFVAYLKNNFLLGASHTRDPHRVFLQRNKRKYSGLDESSALSKALEGVILDNGLECAIICGSHKRKYVRATEDTFFRVQRRTNSSNGTLSSRYQERVERFHKIVRDQALMS